MMSMQLANFRDLGGISTEDGRQVLPKRLLRSGEVVGLREEDKAALTDTYHLRNIIDFRSAAERAEKPDDTLPGVHYYAIDVLKDAASQAPDEKHLLTMLDSPAAVDRFMEKVYQLLITEQTALAGYRQMLDILLAQDKGATLWHCYAGKDRAGLGAAIILSILGVSFDGIMADYLETNKLRAPINAAVLEKVKQKAALSDAQIAAIGIALNVQPAYLQTSYDTAKQQYGSFENYIIKGLGVSADMKQALRRLYLS